MSVQGEEAMTSKGGRPTRVSRAQVIISLRGNKECFLEEGGRVPHQDDRQFGRGLGKIWRHINGEESEENKRIKQLERVKRMRDERVTWKKQRTTGGRPRLTDKRGVSQEEVGRVQRWSDTELTRLGSNDAHQWRGVTGNYQDQMFWASRSTNEWLRRCKK